jgi:hypothetical protein
MRDRAAPKLKRSAQSYADEIAALLCRYEENTYDWRKQDEAWKQIRKRLIQYRIAKKVEEKLARRTLWEAETAAKKEAIKVTRARHQKER